MTITISPEAQIAPAKTWVPLVDEFVRSGKRASRRTQDEYRKIVTKAMTALGVDDVDQLTPSHLTAYRGALVEAMNAGDEDPSKLSASTVALRLTVFRGFLNYARVSGRCSIPADAVKVLLESPSVNVVKPYEVASADEIDQLVEACTSARDKALVTLYAETGLRCAELTSVRASDVHTTAKGQLYVTVTHGKGRKQRNVPLSDRASKLLQAYMVSEGRHLGNGDKGVIFTSRQGDEGLNASRVRQILIAARNKAGLAKQISAHSLRHTAALRWLVKGGDVVSVSKLLGHSKLDVTMRYLDHLEIDDLAKIVNA